MERTSRETSNRTIRSRELRLRERPVGLPQPKHFEVASTVVSCGVHDVLVRNRFFRLAASVRMMVSVGAQAVEGVPFPALQLGDTLCETAIGEVLEAPAGSALARGDRVLHPCGFREFAAVPVEACRRIGPECAEPIALLGHGWTAYAALTRAAQVRRGDTVLVTSAAGAIGSMAALIARHLGAARVIGTTSTRAKAERIRGELGYDAVVARQEGEILGQLRAAAPEGLDVVLDCVGGEQLRAATLCARSGARIALVGALSGQLAEHGSGRSAPVELDSFTLLLSKITLRGYSADDDPEAEAEWNAVFASALRTGNMRFPHTLVHGIEQTPAALCDLMRGRFVGSVIVAL